MQESVAIITPLIGVVSPTLAEITRQAVRRVLTEGPQINRSDLIDAATSAGEPSEVDLDSDFSDSYSELSFTPREMSAQVPDELPGELRWSGSVGATTLTLDSSRQIDTGSFGDDSRNGASRKPTSTRKQAWAEKQSSTTAGSSIYKAGIPHSGDSAVAGADQGSPSGSSNSAPRYRSTRQAWLPSAQSSVSNSMGFTTTVASSGARSMSGSGSNDSFTAYRSTAREQGHFRQKHESAQPSVSVSGQAVRVPNAPKKSDASESFTSVARKKPNLAQSGGDRARQQLIEKSRAQNGSTAVSNQRGAMSPDAVVQQLQDWGLGMVRDSVPPKMPLLERLRSRSTTGLQGEETLEAAVPVGLRRGATSTPSLYTAMRDAQEPTSDQTTKIRLVAPADKNRSSTLRSEAREPRTLSEVYREVMDLIQKLPDPEKQKWVTELRHTDELTPEEAHVVIAVLLARLHQVITTGNGQDTLKTKRFLFE